MKYRTSVLSLYLKMLSVIPTALGSTPRHNQYLRPYVTKGFFHCSWEKKKSNYCNFFRYTDTHSHRSTFNICANRAAQLTRIVIVTTALVSGTRCCFQRARGEGEGHVEVCVCIGIGCGGGVGCREGGVQGESSPGCPLSPCVSPSPCSCMSLTHTWALINPSCSN